MKGKVLLFSVLAVLLIALLLPACKTTPTTTTALPAPTTTTAAPKPTTTAPTTTTAAPSPTTTTPQYGGVLKIIARGTITNLGYPQAPFGPDDGTFNSPAIEKLVTLDTKGNIVPYLATSWQISANYSSITFNLRKGVKFHDGTPFNAAAAKYNLDLFRTGARPDLKTISSIEVIDEYTVKLNYITYDPAVLSNLCFAVGWMFSPTSIEKNGKDGSLYNPVGTGPYKFVSYQRDISMVYTRFDDYWGGKPYLDGLTWVIISDPVTALASLKAGEAQASIIVGLKDASDMLAAGKYNVVSMAAQVNTLGPDSVNATSPFADVRVRQAVAYAIDNAAISKAVGYGFYKPNNQLATTGNWWYNPAIVGYPYNPQKATQLLADAGYAKGLSTTITYQTSPENQDTVTAVQAYLSAVGITVKLDPADAGRFSSIFTNGWNSSMLFPMGIAIGNGSDPARAFMTGMSTKRARFPNIIVPADYNTVLLAAAVEPDAAKRTAMFQDADKLLIDKYCMAIPIYTQYWTCVSSTQVHDMTLNAIAPGVWHPESVWLSK